MATWRREKPQERDDWTMPILDKELRAELG